MRIWGIVAILAGCLLLPGATSSAAENQGTIRAYLVHHGEPGFQKLAQEFEKETGIHVDVTFECRGQMLKLVTTKGDGDVCTVSGQESFDQIEKAGLAVGTPATIGEVIPIIEVLKGNPKNIRSLADLGQAGVRVVLCAGCVGKVADKILAKAQLTEKVKPNICEERVRGDRLVAKAVDGVKADATICWSWTTIEMGPDKYEMVVIPEEHNVIEPVMAFVLKSGKNRAAAEKFVAFLQSERAKEVLAGVGLVRPVLRTFTSTGGAR